MTIKPYAGARTMYIFVAIFAVIVELFLFVDVNHQYTIADVIRMVVITAVMALLIFAGYVAENRTFELDRDGCTVILGRFRKTYTWDSMQIKRYEDFSAAFGCGAFMFRGVVFCTHKAKRPYLIPVALYCTFRHPFSYIYITFIPKTVSERQPIPYGVDKATFLANMAEWNVAIEGMK